MSPLRLYTSTNADVDIGPGFHMGYRPQGYIGFQGETGLFWSQGDSGFQGYSG